MHPWFPSGHRHVRKTVEVLHEFREAQRPRTRRLATGLSATRAPISERPAVVSRTVGVPTCCGNSKEHIHDVEHDQADLSRDRPVAPTAGIDWASADHAVAIVDDRGVQLERFTIAHTAPGLRQLVAPAATRRRRGGRASNAPTGRWSTRCSRPGFDRAS